MTDLTDKEITEACARAAGKKVESEYWSGARERVLVVIGDWDENIQNNKRYNPLTDRAQAMELVEKLEMFIARTNTGFWETYALCSGGKVFSENLLRAICLCAARVQIEKEKNA